MRLVLFVATLLAAIAASAPPGSAQVFQPKPKTKPAEPKAKPAAEEGKVTEALKAWVAKIEKGTPQRIVQKAGGFIREREVTSAIRSSVTASDFASKPWKAEIHFKAQRQQSQIHDDEKGAEKAEWLALGKVAGGVQNASAVPGLATVVLYWKEGKWTAESVSLDDDLSGVRLPAGFRPRRSRMTTKDNASESPWGFLFLMD